MRKLLKVIFVLGAIFGWALLLAQFIAGANFERELQERRAEIVGGLANRYIASQSEPDNNAEVQTVAGLHHIPIQVDRFQNNIFRASGVANSFLIATAEGNVLFDAGLATQGARQKRLLQKAAPGVLTHIILSHSHADHIGAVNFWRQEFPDAKIISHQRFGEGQRYLTELQSYFWNRNRLLYSFMPETPPEEGSLFAYGGLQPEILVNDGSEYRFTLDEVEFVVIPTPGAEGDDNLVLWLPGQKALFSGDFFGPLFPMLPNLFTLRGEKFRDPIAYINSLNKLIRLQPKLILPSHFDPVAGAETLARDMQLMRDATAYVHDETVAGMNAGKSLWQLMRDIQLPPELDLSQGHGKVSWNVRSIWEHYSTWFKYDSTTELYSVPVAEIYADLAALPDDANALLNLAEDKLAAQQPLHALHFIEVYASKETESARAYELKLKALTTLLETARATTNNFSETTWLQSRIELNENALQALQ